MMAVFFINIFMTLRLSFYHHASDQLPQRRRLHGEKGPGVGRFGRRGGCGRW